MTRSDAYAKLQRAAAVFENGGDGASNRILLVQAWEQLRGLRADDFPAEMQPAFSFLQYEISRAAPEELSDREVAFLTGKLRHLESLWTESADEIGFPEAS